MASLFKRQLKTNWNWVLQWRENGRTPTKHIGLVSNTAGHQIEKKPEMDLLYTKFYVFPERQIIP
jgi:hypothetical protein